MTRELPEGLVAMRNNDRNICGVCGDPIRWSDEKARKSSNGWLHMNKTREWYDNPHVPVAANLYGDPAEDAT